MLIHTAKKPSFLLIVCFLCCALTSNAQYSKFNGTWVADSSKIPDENTSGVMTIDHDTLTWNIYNNQMFFNFGYKLKQDTLLLIYKSCDCSHAFKTSNIKFPKPKSVYAKLYLKPDSLMGVIYLNKPFSETVKSYVRTKISKTELRNFFPDILFPKNP